MNVLQLIDSLSVGGAERVAVNFANGLAERGIGSFLCASRQEGGLLNQINKDVKYIFLNRKGRFDIDSVRALLKICKENKIDIIHAHSTSLFLGFAISCLSNIKLVWHNHYGNSVNMPWFWLFIYRILLLKVSYSFFVTSDLYQWGLNKLWLKKNKAFYLPNYPELKIENNISDLFFSNSNKYIVSLANLRKEKDHLSLIDAFSELADEFKDWNLLLVGRDFNDDYSESLFNSIRSKGLSDKIKVLGVRNDIFNILSRCQIGVISSQWEGLPVSLLEYGISGLPVVSTSVGEIPEVLANGEYGILVPPRNSNALANGLKMLMGSQYERDRLGHCFHKHVVANYSKDSALNQLFATYKSILTDDK
jgi:glycosyltransferase involved in cell wall biosynthesis